MYGLKKRQKDESGLIQGAGTGTSDDIKKDVPAGSYIMPADSTQKIGAKNLKKLGKPPTTEVNVSNGEYLASPEQMQEIGGLVLDRMKQQTHVPVDKPKLGFKPGQYKPEMYFANGGSVPDDDTFLGFKKSAFLGNALSGSAPKVATTQNNGASQQKSSIGDFARNMIAPEHDDGSWNIVGGLMNTATGLGRAGVGAAGGLVGGLAEGARSTAAWIGGAENPNTGNIVGPSFDFAGDGLKQAQLGLRQTFGLSPKKEEPVIAQAPPPKAAPTAENKTVADSQKTVEKAVADTKNTNPPAVDTAKPAIDMFAVNQSGTQQQAQANPHAIIQNGNSFTDAATQAAKSGIKPISDPRGVENMLANTRESGASQSRVDKDYYRNMTNFNVPENAEIKGQSVRAAVPYNAGAAQSTDTATKQPSTWNDQQLSPRQNSNVPLVTQSVSQMPTVGGFSSQKYQQSQQALADAFASRGMDLGMQGYGNIARQPQAPQRTAEQEAERQEIIRAASTPIAGARGLTANQVRTLSDMNQGDANRANDVYKTDANNANTLQREAMGQSAQNYRAELGEQGANNRFNSNLNLEAQKFNASNDLENRKFSEEQLNNMPARMKQAYELNILKQYEAAKTPEEKQLLAEKLGLLRGQTKQQGDRFMSINGGQVVDKDGNTTKAPDILIDKNTGQMHDYGASQGQVGIPQAAIEYLQKNPNQAKYFNEMFGNGQDIATKYLKG